MDERQRIEQLESSGYSPVYIWQAEPGEVDELHSHDFDTVLVVLEGEIVVKIGDQSNILHSGDRLDILRGIAHSAVASQDGCRYIVGEKHGGK